MDYYYSLNNQPQGPVPLEQLHELFRTGVIAAETLVVPVGGSEWRPYSTLQPAPQDLAGSAVPGDVPPAATPQPPPSTAAVTPTSAAYGATTAASATPLPGYKNLVLISWVLIGVTALLSIIPILGCFSWVMLIPVVITCVILGVMTLQRGGTTQGVLILIASLVVLPLITIIAPIVTTALFGAVTGLGDENKKRSSPAPLVADASPAPSASAIASPPSATRSPASPAKPAIAQAVEDPTQLFNKLDITQNGYLSGTEMKDYKGYDTNKDDQVSKEEFMAGSARDTRLKAIAATLDAFLIMLNNGQYDQSFDAASEIFRSGVTKAAWANNLRKNRETLGKATDHQLQTIDTNTDLTSGKKTYVVPVASKFEKGSATETITIVQDADNQYRVADYSMTTEFTAPQTAAASSAPGSNKAPEPKAAKQMVNNTMINFKNAVNSGDFEPFYRTQLSDLWKKQITAEKLRTSFKSFIDRKVDLTPIFSVEPVLDEAPYVDGNGLLTLVGHYPVAAEKVKVTFELSYSREAKWALSGIKVNIKGIDE